TCEIGPQNGKSNQSRKCNNHLRDVEFGFVNALTRINVDCGERAQNSDRGSHQSFRIVSRVGTSHVPAGLETSPPRSTWDDGKDAKRRGEDRRTSVKAPDIV